MTEERTYLDDLIAGRTTVSGGDLPSPVNVARVHVSTGLSVVVQNDVATLAFNSAASGWASEWFDSALNGYGVPAVLKVDVSANSSLRVAYNETLNQLTLSSIVPAAPSEWFDSALNGYGVPAVLKVDVSANSSLRVAYNETLNQLTLSGLVAANPPEWFNNSFPPVAWGNPRYIVLSATDFATSYDAPTETLLLALPEKHRLDHEAVECVLLEQPNIVTGGWALPTVEQADGWTLASGQRCLNPFGTQGGILVHDGAKLVAASDYTASHAAGHRVFVRHGRIYRQKTFHTWYGLSGLEWWSPMWLCEGGPTRGAQKTVAASGSAGWVLLLSVPLSNEAGVAHDVSIRAMRWVSSTYASKRVYRGECTYVSDGTTTSAAPGMDPIVLHEAGETDAVSRMKVENSGTSLSVWGYRDAAGGTSWDYRVELTLVDDLLSRPA